jgi:hypothetical protein
MIDVLILDAGDSWPQHLTLIAAIAFIGSLIIYTAHRKKPDPLSHLARYEVAPDGTLENQFPTAESLLRYAYNKVSLRSSRVEYGQLIMSCGSTRMSHS